MVTINNDQREDQMFNFETSITFLIVYLIAYVTMVFATVPTRAGKIVLTVYGLIFMAVFKIAIDGVPLV